MAVPRISVVVPFYNNVDQLGDCLDSIAAQADVDLAVVMVDDGSTDGSTEVAAARAAADPRFTLVRVPNGGPGSARNHGVAAATGEFLAFVDADDLLPPDAYQRQLAVLEASDSDFVCGAVLRLTGTELGPSGLHDQAIKARRLGTHISKTPELLYDISVFNKLFRRSFWDNAGLRFPEGMLWEDLVAMTKAHVLARAVDVVPEPVYWWRDRDKGAPSITQSRMRIGNFRDRITALTMIDDFLREKATPALLRAHQHKALINDLWLYVRDLSGADEDYQREFTELAGGYLRQVDHRVVTAMPATRKLAYYLISEGRQADLVGYAGWLAANPGRTPPIVRSFGRLRADLPGRTRAACSRLGVQAPVPRARPAGPGFQAVLAGPDARDRGQRLRSVDGYRPAPEHDQARGAGPARPPQAADRRARPVGAPARGDWGVRADQVLLRLGRLPVRDQPALVRRRRTLADRRLGLLRAGQRPVGVAPGPAALARAGRGASNLDRGRPRRDVRPALGRTAAAGQGPARAVDGPGGARLRCRAQRGLESGRPAAAHRQRPAGLDGSGRAPPPRRLGTPRPPAHPAPRRSPGRQPRLHGRGTRRRDRHLRRPAPAPRRPLGGRPAWPAGATSFSRSSS